MMDPDPVLVREFGCVPALEPVPIPGCDPVIEPRPISDEPELERPLRVESDTPVLPESEPVYDWVPPDAPICIPVPESECECECPVGLDFIFCSICKCSFTTGRVSVAYALASASLPDLIWRSIKLAIALWSAIWA